MKKIKSSIERRKIKKLFSKYVDEETIDKILDENTSELEMNKLEKSLIDFVLIKARDKPIENIQNHIKKVIEIAAANNGLVENIISSVVVISFFKNEEDEKTKNRKKLVDDLLKNKGNDISIVHGKIKGYYGNLGNSSSFHFGSIISNVSNYIALLDSLEFRECKEIS
jgi:hypothetical protein